MVVREPAELILEEELLTPQPNKAVINRDNKDKAILFATPTDQDHKMANKAAVVAPAEAKVAAELVVSPREEPAEAAAEAAAVAELVASHQEELVVEEALVADY